MLDVFTVAFFGHRRLDDVQKIEEVLEEKIQILVSTREYVEFLVGRNGDFDQCAASAVRRVKKRYREDNSSLTLVMPYDTAEYRNNMDSFAEYYDGIEISSVAAIAHPKAAIQIRNREMVDRADLVIGYITHESGGAWKTIQYALKQGKDVVNIAEEIKNFK